MKCNPLRWVWGLLPIAALAYAVGHYERERIESDLTQRVETEFRAKKLTWAKVKFDGRDAVITGRATDEAEPPTAERETLETFGVRVAKNRAELIERADAYTWWAESRPNRVTLRGLVPNENTRTSILGTARQIFPGSQVTDEMRLARGAPNPDTWLTGIGFGLNQLKALKGGELRLDGLGLTLAGEAATSANYTTVKSALQSGLPRGIKLTEDRVTPPVVRPYTWAARAANGQVTLSGYVPNTRLQSDLQDTARAEFKRAPSGRLEIADGAPSGYATVVSTSLRELARLEEGTASLSDTTLTFEGLAGTEETAVAVRRALRNALPQNYRLTDQIRFREAAPPAAISPYIGSVDAEANRIVLTGYAPSETVRQQIEQAARTRFPGRAIDNRLAIGPGAPDGWVRCFDGGMLGLARVGSGRMAMTDRRLELTARTDDEDMVTSVPSDVRNAVQGACDTNARIEYIAAAEPDLRWSAKRDGSLVVLSGMVASAATRTALLAQARRQFPAADVRDNMRVADSRSRSWPRAAEIGLTSLADLDVGEAVLDGQKLTVIGEMRYEPSMLERVRERLRSEMPRGYGAREQITMLRPTPPPPPPPVEPPKVTSPQPPSPPMQPPVQARPQPPEQSQAPPPVAAAQPSPPPSFTPPPPRTEAGRACQVRLRETARNGVISFDRARALLTAESTLTLDRIANIARNCPGVRITIEGHTDSEGTPERNKRLSDRRADAVRDYLTRQGRVDAAILTAAGFGETRPVAPNDTAENRARNRRIDFTVSD